MVKEEVQLTEVDVIITTRNRVAELLTTIERCIAIGFSPLQIFITDDASSDNTPETVRLHYPEVRLHVNQGQSGLISNRNFMMKQSSRRYILSLDDDSNLLSRSDLQEALNLLNSREEYGVFGFIPFEQLEVPPPKHTLKTDVFTSKSYIGCGHIIKRAALHNVGFYREEYFFYGEEMDFSIRCFKEGLYVVKKADLIVHHRVNYQARDNNLKGDKNKGEYGILWRSEYAMANRLSHILINYPLAVMPLYLIKSLSGFFYTYVIKRKWLNCYRLALVRVGKRTNYIINERNPLTLKQFRQYIKLEE